MVLLGDGSFFRWERRATGGKENVYKSFTAPVQSIPGSSLWYVFVWYQQASLFLAHCCCRRKGIVMLSYPRDEDESEEEDWDEGKKLERGSNTRRTVACLDL